MTQYHVTLNGQGYVLDLDRYQKRIREPFAAKQSQGAPAFGDLRGPEQALVISDWSGGEGYVQHDDAAPSRWRQGSGLDGYSVPGALQLGPYAVQIASTSDTYLGYFAVYGNRLYVGGSSGAVYSWDGTTFALSTTLPGNVRSLEVFLNRLYAGNATTGAVARFDGTTWTAAAFTAGGTVWTLKTHYREAAQYLYVGASSAGVNGVARVYYWDGATLSLGQFDPEELYVPVAFHLNESLYFCAADHLSRSWGLYSVDRAGSGGSWRTHARVRGLGYIHGAAVVNGVAYLGDFLNGRIWVWDGNELTVARVLTQSGGQYTGVLQGMVAWRGALWVGIKEGAGLGLLRYDGASWSRPVAGLAGDDVTGLGVWLDTLYVGTGHATTSRVYQVSPYLYGALGTLESGLISCGLPGVSKLFRSVTLVTSALAASQSVQVEYRLEDAGAWTGLGTLSAVGATTATYSFAAQTTGRQIAFRLTVSGAAGASSSPVLHELVLRYVPRPTIAREWDLAVVLEGTPDLPLVTLDGDMEPLTGAQLTQLLWAAAGSAGPVTLVDLDGATYPVYVQDVREEIGKLSQRKGYQRLGLVKLVEAA